MKHLLVALMLVLALGACGKDDKALTDVKPGSENGTPTSPEDSSVINDSAKITWAEVEKSCNENLKTYGFEEAAIAKYCDCAVNVVSKKKIALETFVKHSEESLQALYEDGLLDQCDKKPIFSSNVYPNIY